nr:aminotransferase class I/II-fold pyridoxal phosphate-dependent enzyme [Fredinandcohnia onubensis]
MKHISRRNEIKRNGIREIMEMALEMDEEVIQLQVGEPFFETPAFIKEAAISAIQNNLTRYTANAGFPSLRQAIMNRMKTKYDVELNMKNIIVTPGAVAAINIALLSIVDNGEEVLIPDPCYPNYDALIRLQNAVPKYYPTDPQNEYLPNVEKLKEQISDKTRAILLNSPNNPTGAVIPKEMYQEIIDVAKEKNIYIISDEIYDELIYDREHISALSVDLDYNDHIIAIYGFSKSFAMTGWRLGYAIIPEHLYGITTKLQEPITTCASSVSQKAGEAALNSPFADKFVEETREIYKKKRDMACELLSKYQMNFVKPNGAFYIVIDISKTNMNSMDFAKRLLLEEKVAVAPCTTFGPSGEKMIRVCFAGDDRLLQKGIEILGRFYQDQIVEGDLSEKLCIQ